MTETPTCTYTALAAACRQFMPKGLALDNANVPDDLAIPLDATMGELRRLQAAIDAADQAADRQVSGVALLKLVQNAEDLSTASALVQAALDFLTNDEAALAEGCRWAPDEGGGSNLQKMQVAPSGPCPRCAGSGLIPVGDRQYEDCSCACETTPTRSDEASEP